MTDPVPFSERDDDDSIDDLLAMIADVTQTDDPEELVHELVGSMMQSTEVAGVLGNFIFIGEIVDADAVSRLMVVTSDNLPDWVARGMLMCGEEFIMGGGLE